jgi:hypothetical protein
VRDINKVFYLFIISTCKILVILESLYGTWPSFLEATARVLTTELSALILKTQKQKSYKSCKSICIAIKYQSINLQSINQSFTGADPGFCSGGVQGVQVNRGGCNPQNQRKTLQNSPGDKVAPRGGAHPLHPPPGSAPDLINQPMFF